MAKQDKTKSLIALQNKSAALDKQVRVERGVCRMNKAKLVQRMTDILVKHNGMNIWEARIQARKILGWS